MPPVLHHSSISLTLSDHIDKVKWRRLASTKLSLQAWLQSLPVHHRVLRLLSALTHNTVTEHFHQDPSSTVILFCTLGLLHWQGVHKEIRVWPSWFGVLIVNYTVWLTRLPDMLLFTDLSEFFFNVQASWLIFICTASLTVASVCVVVLIFCAI